MRKPAMALVLVTLIALSGCTFVAQPEADQPVATESGTVERTPALFVLPDGNQCGLAGTGVTLAFDGKRLNYLCDQAPEDILVGILGDPVVTGATEWEVEVAYIGRDSDGFVLEWSALVTFMAWDISLVDGVRCLHAGFGATLAFEGERVNYTCDTIAAGARGPEHGGDWVLLGRLVNDGEGVWLAERAEIGPGSDGFEVLDQSQVVVSMVSGLDLTEAMGGDSMNPLAGTTWQWLHTEYGDGSVLEAADPSRYTLTFIADGSLTAQVDCNRGRGTYTVVDSSLEIGPLATTRMMCPEGSQDHDFLKDLDIAVTYIIEDDYLYVALMYDTGIMVFASAE